MYDVTTVVSSGSAKACRIDCGNSMQLMKNKVNQNHVQLSSEWIMLPPASVDRHGDTQLSRARVR